MNNEHPKANAETTVEWARRETRRRTIDEGPGPVDLKPVESFPHGQPIFNNAVHPRRPRAPGEPCRALDVMVNSYCCGWRRKPTALEAEAAIKSRLPTDRNTSIAFMVLTEPPNHLVIEGEADSAYSLQDVAWWLHHRPIPAYGRIRWLNAFARRARR